MILNICDAINSFAFQFILHIRLRIYGEQRFLVKYAHFKICLSLLNANRVKICVSLSKWVHFTYVVVFIRDTFIFH